MKTGFIPVICFIAIMSFSSKTRGQNSYSFTLIPPGAIQYQELLQDSDVTLITDSQGYFGIDALAGETFQIYNTQNIIGTNAWLYLGDNGFMEMDNYTDSTFAIFDAAFTQHTTIDSTSRMSYLVTGTSGNLIVHMQFKNWKLTNGGAGNYVNYQIRLFQQTGVIEYHYGGRSANNVSGYTVSNGPNAGTFLSPFDFSGCIEKVWCRGNPNNPLLDSTANYQFLAMQGLPDSGTVYRFTPQFPVGIDKQSNAEQSRISIFPSLANTTINVALKDMVTESEALICDASGRKVQAFHLVSGFNEINISDLKEGMYFLYVNNNGQNYVAKFVKTR